MVRWTAPDDGEVEVSAAFTGIAERATTDVHVLHNGRPLFDGVMNLERLGQRGPLRQKIAVAAGDTIDCVVGSGNGNYGGGHHGAGGDDQVGRGKTYDATADFSDRSQSQRRLELRADCARARRPTPRRFALYPAEARPRARSAASQSRVGRLGGRAQRPARLPARAAHGRDRPVAADARRPAASPCSSRNTGSAAPWTCGGRCGTTSSAAPSGWRTPSSSATSSTASWPTGSAGGWTRRSPARRTSSWRACARWPASGLLGLNAIRSNPNIIGHSLTGAIDHVMCGEGLTTMFRELKPGTIDAMFDAWAPLRWCLFAEPVHVARGAKVRLEAVLANEDALAPGEYPVRLQVVGPEPEPRFCDRTVTVTIPERAGNAEPPLALRCFAEDVAIDGPAGKYRFLATFERGRGRGRRDAEFYVTDPAEMPAVEAEVVLWGDDPALAKWLAEHGIRTRPFALPRGRGPPRADAK